MAFKGVTVAVPSDGSEVPVANDQVVDPSGFTEPIVNLAYRNTGTVDLYVGGSGSCVFPLKVGEFIGWSLTESRNTSILFAKIQSGSTAGEIRALEDR